MPSQVLVVCKADAQLVSLDARSLEVRWRADLSDVGHEVTASPAGTFAYVPLYGTGGPGRPGRSGDGVDVIDLRRGARVGTIPLPEGSRPHFAGWGRDRRLYVSAEGIGSVLSVDVTDYEGRGDEPPCPALRQLRTGHLQTHMLAVSPNGGLVYTADVSPGTITELDVRTGGRRSLRLAERVNRISLSADGSTAYVADQDEPRLAVVHLRSMTLARWIDLPHVAFGTAAMRDGRVAIALRHAGRVALLDPHAGRVHASLPVPRGPQRVVLDATGRTAYVTCSPAGVVVAIDLVQMRIVVETSTGGDPDGACFVAE